MSLSFPTYPLSKKYTDETVVGGGAIKGKNLVVTSIESITGGKRINVQWTLDDGTVQTDHVDLENGEDGKGIKSVAINAEEHLIITYTDDTTSDAGKIEIQSAVDSVNGETGDVVLVLTDIVNVGSNLTYNSTTKTLSADAQAQVQADWEQSDNTQADYIKNKPTLGTASEKDAINAVLAGSPSLPTGDAVKTAIDEAVSGAYHHAGTKTVAELTSALLVEANDGNVYNMTDSGVTTADFIEGAGKPIAIGDNVGIAKVGENTYKFDLLSGFVDTTLFIQKSSTTGLIKNDGTIDTTDYADKSEMSITDGTGADLGTSTIQLKSGTSKKVLTEHQDVTGKADKVQNATNNHIALLDGLGNLKDGGKAITDLIPNGGTTGQVLAKHSNTDGDVEWKDVQSGGHTIENASGTALTQRDTLQFKGGLSVSDDSTNEVTVVDDTVPEIEWSVWNAMTPQEQEAIPNAIILNAPDSGGGSGIEWITKEQWDAMTPEQQSTGTYGVQGVGSFGGGRRTRVNITSNLSSLSQAVSEQNLEKYGYSIGDYFIGASGYHYVLADYNTFKGTLTPPCVTDNHLGIVVRTHQTHEWHSGDVSSVGYAGSTLQSYLNGTVLNNIKSDFTSLFENWNNHLIAHNKLFTIALASWEWNTSQYISALTCNQLDASSQWSANAYQEGEACKSLELFRKYKWTEILGNEYTWLRNISSYNDSGLYACFANDGGNIAGSGGVENEYYATGLILFK